MHAVLGAAEAEHVDARPPGHVGGAAAEARAGIGEAGPVHVQAQAERPAGRREGAQLGEAVDLPRLGRLRDGDDAGLGEVDVGARGERPDGARRQLAALRAGDEELRAVREEFGRAALVGLDMGRIGADHAVVGLAQGGQRQRVGGRAVEGEEDLALRLEQGAEGVSGARRPGILAIGGGVAAVGRLHRGPGLRADAGIVVAGELLRVARHRLSLSDRLPLRTSPERLEVVRSWCKGTRKVRTTRRFATIPMRVPPGRSPGQGRFSVIREARIRPGPPQTDCKFQRIQSVAGTRSRQQRRSGAPRPQEEDAA